MFKLKNLVLLFCLLFSLPVLASQGNTGYVNVGSSNTSGILPVANGGTGQVAGLTFNSIGSAAANTTAINAALASGGFVNIGCPVGSVIYINANLIAYSNSQINNVSGCTIRATASTGALLVNEAALSAWTTIWDNSGSITTGPLAIIWNGSTPAWSANSGSGTAYVKGNYVTANSNIYWESVSSCTGATIGSGPSGTGTGISDGTCSWNYITTSPSSVCPITGNFLCATVHEAAHSLTVGDTAWLTPEPDAPMSSNMWTGTGSAGQIGGLADSAYFGVFQVIYLNDANYFTVTLRRNPVTAFSGIPMNVKKADSNITLTGTGIWDYNSGTNSGSGPINQHAIVMAGVRNLKIDKSQVINNAKYAFDIAGVSDGYVLLADQYYSGSGSDRVKIYGPAYNMTVDGSDGINHDDVVSAQTEEPSTFSQFIIAAGDVIGVTVKNITSENSSSAGAIAVYASNPYLYMDDLNVINVSPANTSTEVVIENNNSGTTSNVGTINVEKVEARGEVENIVQVGGSGSTVVNQLNIVNSSGGVAVTAGSILNMQATSSTIIHNVNINGDHAIASAPLIYVGTGTIENLNIDHNYFKFPSAGTVVTNTTTTGVTTNINVAYNDILGTPSQIVNNSNASNINFLYNYVPNMSSSFGFAGENVGGSVLTTTGNYAPNATFMSAFGTFATTIYSGGGNTFSSWFNNRSGTRTFTFYGWDIRCDVTLATRTTGEYCFNTNTSPGSGTLTTAGLVADQGTSSGSWFALYSPVLQTY